MHIRNTEEEHPYLAKMMQIHADTEQQFTAFNLPEWSTGTVGTGFQGDTEMMIYGNDRQKDFSCGFVKICEAANPRIVRLRGSEQDCYARYHIPNTLLS